MDDAYGGVKWKSETQRETIPWLGGKGHGHPQLERLERF